MTFDDIRCGSPLRLHCDPVFEYMEDARLDEDGKTGSGCFRQFEEVEDAETEVANVDTERMLWLLYRVNVLLEVFVLAIEFRQLFDEDELIELLATARPLRVLVGDVARHDGCCGWGSPLTCTAVSDCEVGGDDCGCDVEGIGGGPSPMITFDTWTARAEPEFEFGCESDRVLRAASPALFPNENHLLDFFVTVGVATGAGTGGGGGGGTLGNDWTEAEAERVWRLSSRTSV